MLKNTLMVANISTTKGVHLLVKKIFNIDYSARQVSRILRGLGMTLQKPYSYDYRRPQNAEALLQNQWKVLSLTIIIPSTKSMAFKVRNLMVISSDFPSNSWLMFFLVLQFDFAHIFL